MNILPLVDIGGIWHIAYFLGCAVSILYWGFNLSLHRSINFLTIYACLYALFILEYPLAHFGLFTASFQATAGQALIEIILIPYLVFQGSKYIKKILPYVVAFSLACVWFKWSGLLSAGSFHTAFAALCIPFVAPWLVLAIYITVITHHGSTALLIIGAQIMADVIKFKGYRLIYLLFFGFVLGAAWLFRQEYLLNDMGRLHQYQTSMAFWVRNWKWVVFGVGPGSYIWTSVMLSKFNGELFLQMHSDWLQILWELGLIGFGLTVWVFVSAAKHAWHSPRLLAALFGAAAFGLTYHPLRLFPSAVVVCWILLKCFSYTKDSSVNYQ